MLGLLVWVAVVGLPFGHAHVDASAVLNTSTITDMRLWFGCEGAAAGLTIGVT